MPSSACADEESGTISKPEQGQFFTLNDTVTLEISGTEGDEYTWKLWRFNANGTGSVTREQLHVTIPANGKFPTGYLASILGAGSYELRLHAGHEAPANAPAIATVPFTIMAEGD